jgi:hypothetical protein
LTLGKDEAGGRFEPSEFFIINDSIQNSRWFRTELMHVVKKEVLKHKKISLSGPLIVENIFPFLFILRI